MSLEIEHVLDEIRKLDEQRDEGVVTEEEFQEKRRNLIAPLTANHSQSGAGGR